MVSQAFEPDSFARLESLTYGTVLLEAEQRRA